jgi:hypothetical protein
VLGCQWGCTTLVNYTTFSNAEAGFSHVFANDLFPITQDAIVNAFTSKTLRR